jgi:hypothetical protein
MLLYENWNIREGTESVDFYAGAIERIRFELKMASTGFFIPAQFDSQHRADAFGCDNLAVIAPIWLACEGWKLIHSREYESCPSIKSLHFLEDMIKVCAGRKCFVEVGDILSG